MVGMGGFEPPHASTKNWCLTTWLHPNEIFEFQNVQIINLEQIFLDSK